MSGTLFPDHFRRKPDVVEAMQWLPSEASMQDVLSWVRDEGQVFKTVGRQLWIQWIQGDGTSRWMIAHPTDYVVRKTQGERYFYVESETKFQNEREAHV